MAKEQLKNKKAKRENSEKLYKITKHDLVMALKERDENRMIRSALRRIGKVRLLGSQS